MIIARGILAWCGPLVLAGGMASAAGLQTGAPPGPAPAAAGAPAATDQSALAEDEAEAVLTMKDGQRFSGLMVSRDADKIVLRIAGIKTTFSLDAIDRVRVLPPVMQRYRELRAAIDDTDTEQLLRLVDWLVERRRYQAALDELDGILKRSPQNATVLRRRDGVQRQADLREKSRALPPPAADPAPPAPPAGRVPTSAGALDSFPYLSEEQVALIKVYEVDLSRNPRLDIPSETITKFLDEFAGHPLVPQTREGKEALRRKDPALVLDLMFRCRARDLYPSVKVIDQPASIKVFRDEVLRGWVLNACASNSCHGGTEAGRLVLSNRNPGSDATTYTDLLILDRFRLADGRPLIDWESPERSALLHMGLPRDETQARHPVVLRGGGEGRDAWRPAFRATTDERFKATVAWILSMYRPRPDYGIDYVPVRPFEAPVRQTDPGAR